MGVLETEREKQLVKIARRFDWPKAKRDFLVHGENVDEPEEIRISGLKIRSGFAARPEKQFSSLRSDRQTNVAFHFSCVRCTDGSKPRSRCSQENLENVRNVFPSPFERSRRVYRALILFVFIPFLLKTSNRAAVNYINEKGTERNGK